nr:MAG TPA: hypothetical protein [Caudoviricetes sp.]
MIANAISLLYTCEFLRNNFFFRTSCNFPITISSILSTILKNLTIVFRTLLFISNNHRRFSLSLFWDIPFYPIEGSKSTINLSSIEHGLKSSLISLS